MTSFNLMILGWFIFLNAFTSDSCRHSSQVPYFFLRRLIATIYFVSVFWAFSTLPNVPEPNFWMIWYFYIILNIGRELIKEMNYITHHAASRWSSPCPCGKALFPTSKPATNLPHWLGLECRGGWIRTRLHLTVDGEHVTLVVCVLFGQLLYDCAHCRTLGQLKF